MSEPLVRSAEVADLADHYWDAVLRSNPLFGTMAGDDRFDDRLPDVGLAARSAEESAFRSALDGARRIGRDGLEEVDRTTLDVIAAHALAQVERIELGYDLLEAVDHLWGPATLESQLLEIQPLATGEQVGRFQARLEAVPAYLAGSMELMREGTATGTVASAVVLERTARQVDLLLAKAPEAWPAVAAVPAEERTTTTEIIRDRILPAYASYRRALEGYGPFARTGIGLGALPGGDELYASRVRAWTSLDTSPAAVHEAGRAALELIDAEKREIAKRLGHRSVEAAVEAAVERTRTISRTEIEDAAKRMVERGWEASGSWFGRMPGANCVVRPVEASREDDILDYYIQATQDGSRAGTFFVSTRPGRSLYRLATTAYHESSPGHHLQTALEQEAVDRPLVRRFSASLVGGGFCEGWGLYAERLADEMGLFEDDYERLGMLELQALRAARLVVDTGIHAFGWDREQAIALLEATWADNRAEAEIEIDRYIALPGQALCYALGQHEIKRWRREMAEREGAAFSLATFHDRLLALGSLPLDAIERELLAAPDAGGAR